MGRATRRRIGERGGSHEKKNINSLEAVDPLLPFGTLTSDVLVGGESLIGDREGKGCLAGIETHENATEGTIDLKLRLDNLRRISVSKLQRRVERCQRLTPVVLTRARTMSSSVGT